MNRKGEYEKMHRGIGLHGSRTSFKIKVQEALH